MLYTFKRKFEKAARGQGNMAVRALTLIFGAPLYFFMRFGNSVYGYFKQENLNKHYTILTEGFSYGIKGGTAARIALAAMVFFIAPHISIGLIAFELIVAGYTAIIFGAIGMVNGKDEAQVNSYITGAKQTPAKLVKMQHELPKPSKNWNTLQIYTNLRNEVTQAANSPQVAHQSRRHSICCGHVLRLKRV